MLDMYIICIIIVSEIYQRRGGQRNGFRVEGENLEESRTRIATPGPSQHHQIQILGPQNP